MRALGWSLVGLGFVAVLLTTWSGREDGVLVATFIASIVLGSLILLTSFSLRMLRGEVQFRLWDAAKMATWIFAALMALRLVLATVFFPESPKTLGEHILASALIAIFLSLYQTAYRKPA